MPRVLIAERFVEGRRVLVEVPDGQFNLGGASRLRPVVSRGHQQAADARAPVFGCDSNVADRGVWMLPAIWAGALVEEGELNEADDLASALGDENDAVLLVQQVVDVVLGTCRFAGDLEVVGEGVPMENVRFVEQLYQRRQIVGRSFPN